MVHSYLCDIRWEGWEIIIWRKKKKATRRATEAGEEEKTDQTKIVPRKAAIDRAIGLITTKDTTPY